MLNSFKNSKASKEAQKEEEEAISKVRTEEETTKISRQPQAINSDR
jgi:hypothetical protein